MRRGGVQFLARQGVDVWRIQALARHSSAAILGYLDNVHGNSAADVPRSLQQPTGPDDSEAIQALTIAANDPEEGRTVVPYVGYPSGLNASEATNTASDPWVGSPPAPHVDDPLGLKPTAATQSASDPWVGSPPAPHVDDPLGLKPSAAEAAVEGRRTASPIRPQPLKEAAKAPPAKGDASSSGDARHTDETVRPNRLPWQPYVASLRKGAKVHRRSTTKPQFTGCGWLWRTSALAQPCQSPWGIPGLEGPLCSRPGCTGMVSDDESDSSSGQVGLAGHAGSLECNIAHARKTGQREK